MSNSNNDEWETDSEDYFRLKIDNLTKVKQQLNKIIKLKSKKYKKLNSEDYNDIKNYTKYIKEEVHPNISVYDNNISALAFKNEDYNLVNKPEVGTNLIFEINKNSLNLIGTSQNFYEATTKIYRKINKEKQIIEKPKIRKKKLRKDKEIKNDNNIEPKKSKKRRRKFKHKRNSTIIEIRKVNKD
jgi:hypothetical protein